MFSSSNEYVMILAVIVSMIFIIFSIYFVHKTFNESTKEVLVKFILLVFTALVSVYVIDKVIAFRVSLLSEQEDKDLFDLIKTLILMIFSYYFGTKNSKDDPNK